MYLSPRLRSFSPCVRGSKPQLARRSRSRSVVLHAKSIDFEVLVDVPDVAADVESFQEQLGALFDDDGVATSYGEENDRKAREAWQHGVVLVDRSHWGRLRFSGDDRLRFLHSQATQSTEGLPPGQGLQTVFTTPSARILDTAIVLSQIKGAMAIVSPGMAELLCRRLDKYIFPMDAVSVADVSARTKMFTLLGPHAEDILREWGGQDLAGLPQNGHAVMAFNATPVITVNSSGLGAGVPGWTFIVDETVGADFWRKAALTGAVPMGTDTWEHARILNGLPSLGSELSELYNPLEAGLYHAVSLAKGCYVGQETIAKVYNNNGVKQQLWGLRGRQGAACTAGDTVTWQDGSKAGTVTSVTHMQQPFLALAYLRCKRNRKQIALENEQVVINGEPAKVVPLPALSREFPNEAIVKDAQVASGDRKETDKAAEAKAAKLAAMQARMASWKQQQG